MNNSYESGINNKGRLIIVSGPSGVGKSGLLKEILKKYKDRAAFSVSFTSRDKRAGEIEGVDYHFVTKMEFEEGIKKGLFLEWAKVHDNYYATSIEKVDAIINQGKDCLLDIDVQGASILIKKKIKGMYIFIAPPDMKTLKERLLKRGTDTLEIIDRRVKNAEKEMKLQNNYQYKVINDDFNKALNELENIIFYKGVIQ